MTDFETLMLYLGTFSVSIFFVWRYQKFEIFNKSLIKRIMAVGGIVLPVIVLQGFRYEVGTDYRSYFGIFEAMEPGSRVYINMLNEPLFVYADLLLKKYFHTPLSFFIFSAVVMNLLFFFVVDYYRDSLDMPIAYLAYYMLCFSYFLNVERQALSCILVWFSLRFVEKRQPIRFVLAVACAALYHNSAAICLLLYLLRLLQDGRMKKILKQIAASGILLGFAFYDGIAELALRAVDDSGYGGYAVYILEKDAYNGRVTMVYYFAMLLFPIVVFYRYLDTKEPSHYTMLFCTAGIFLFTLLTPYSEVGSRLVFYMEIGLIVLLGRICRCMRIHTNRYIIKCYAVCSLFLFYYRMFYFFGHADVFPYRFWQF